MSSSPAKVSVGSNEQNAVDFITTLLDASTEYAIIGIDINGRVLLWNEGARRMYGYQPEEVVGRANFAVLSSANDAAQRKPREILETVLHSGKWEGVLDCVRKNGQQFFARVVVTTRRNGNRAVAGFLVVSKDITNEIRFEELKAMQFYTRSLIDANIDALLTTDLLGTITDVNAQFCEMTGYRQHELIGSAFKQYFTDPLKAEQCINTVRTKERLLNYELIMHSRTGSTGTLSGGQVMLHHAWGAGRPAWGAGRPAWGAGNDSSRPYDGFPKCDAAAQAR